MMEGPEGLDTPSLISPEVTAATAAMAVREDPEVLAVRPESLAAREVNQASMVPAATEVRAVPLLTQTQPLTPAMGAVAATALPHPEVPVATVATPSAVRAVPEAMEEIASLLAAEMAGRLAIRTRATLDPAEMAVIACMEMVALAVTEGSRRTGPQEMEVPAATAPMGMAVLAVLAATPGTDLMARTVPQVQERRAVPEGPEA